MTKSKKCSITQRGRLVIHKGKDERRVSADELQVYLEDGWEMGFTEEHSQRMCKAHLGKEPWNKGTVGVMHKNKTSFQKGNSPWNKGKRGSQVSWAKGLTKETDERILKISEKLHMAWERNPERKVLAAKTCSRRKGTHLTKDARLKFVERCNSTKSRNGTFNTSTAADKYYLELCEVFGEANVLREYTDQKRYPFCCDFYIPSEDLFIELNLHWTHGGRPYDPEDASCLEQLREWEGKAQASKFYENAIETWTVRDVKKQRTAKENNLNYKIIY